MEYGGQWYVDCTLQESFEVHEKTENTIMATTSDMEWSPRASAQGKLMVSNTAITVHPENRKEFFQTVSSISSKIRREKGCISFRLYEEAGNENSLLLVGEWDDRSFWERHCEGENFAILHGSVQVLTIRSKIGHKLLSESGD